MHSHIMKLHKLLIAAMLIVSPFAVNGQTKSKALSAHNKIHQQQLANVKSTKMDKSVISEMLKEEVAKRETNLNTLSKESSIMIGDLLSEARRHIGKPYRRGSKGPKSFDCSGFSSYVYRQFGYKISPSSRDQYREGVSVQRK